MRSGGDRQQWQKQRQSKGRQQSTKKWQQRYSTYYFKCKILNITQLHWKEQGAVVWGRDDSGNGVGSQQRQAQGQATVAKAEVAQGQTTINQKVVAKQQKRCWWRRRQWQPWQWQHDNATAMAAMTAAPTWRRQWMGGQPMWAEVIFHSTYYYLHDSMYICDDNCQAYGKTQKCFDSKHKCVLNWQNTFVFSICGACLLKHFRKDTVYLRYMYM